MKHLMIDYENMHRANVQSIAADTHVWLFIGASQPTPSVAQSDFLFKHFGMERIHFIKIHWVAPNALDFCLSYHLGKIIESDPEAQVWILSKDQGFSVLVRQINMEEKASKVATAFNLPDLIEKMSANDKPVQVVLPENAPAENDNPAAVQITFQAAETAPEAQNTAPKTIPVEQMGRRYVALCYQLLRQASNSNILNFQRRTTLETNLARYIKNNTWKENADIICDEADLQFHIQNAINRYIANGFIVENEQGVLSYFFADAHLYERIKTSFFKDKNNLPKSVASASNQFKTMASSFHLGAELDNYVQKWLQQFQEEQLLWVCGDCISYESEAHARDMALKTRFLKNLQKELGNTLRPNSMTVLKQAIRDKAKDELVNLSEEEIYQIVAQLVNSKRVFFNGDDLMWASAPQPQTHSPAPKTAPYNKKTPYAPPQQRTYTPWSKVLHTIKGRNRPSNVHKLKVHLIHVLNTMNQTESDIDRFIQRLVDERYLSIDEQTGFLTYYV